MPYDTPKVDCWTRISGGKEARKKWENREIVEKEIEYYFEQGKRRHGMLRFNWIDVVSVD